jgi:hypothetical protein
MKTILRIFLFVALLFAWSSATSAQKTMPVWVEKKELVREYYYEWTVGTNLLGAFLSSSRDVSTYYDPHYNWKHYPYRLAFKRF